MTASFVLYTREHCHLCDQAARLLDALGVSYREVDIDEDAGLEARYGLKVPVLAQPAKCREICYPFAEEAVRSFVGQ